jgi:hypothetical protein
MLRRLYRCYDRGMDKGSTNRSAAPGPKAYQISDAAQRTGYYYGSWPWVLAAAAKLLSQESNGFLTTSMASTASPASMRASLSLSAEGCIGRRTSSRSYESEPERKRRYGG